MAAKAGGHLASLMVSDNVILDVEIQPQKEVWPHAGGWSAEVFGILKSVDFEKRVIYIRAKPEDWRCLEAR